LFRIAAGQNIPYRIDEFNKKCKGEKMNLRTVTIVPNVPRFITLDEGSI
jgi:hypothetical protein